MAILDGPKGYNKRLISDGLYIEGSIRVEYAEPREAELLFPVLPKPTILVPSQLQPIQPFDEDLPYISDFLRGSKTARAVVATRCKFGWPQLSIDCICLYVDDDDTTGLDAFLASEKVPVVVMKAQFSHAMDDVSKAQQFLEPSGLNKLELSKRRCLLRKNPLPCAVQENGHISHGQSVSLMGQESKGSVGVFLSPSGAEQKIYALTAYHVLPFKTVNESLVKTPARLDLLSQLLAATENADHDRVGGLLRRWDESCGHVVYGHIGTTMKGWKSDFALFYVNDKWTGANGQWYKPRELTDLVMVTEKYQSEFLGVHGLVGNLDPQAGQICYKDGAATGRTTGTIGQAEALVFLKGTADIAPPGTAPTDVDKSKLLTLHQPYREHAVYAKGDSGCGLFVPVPDEDGWKWVGQLVGMLHVENGPPVGLIIPQTQVLESLKENTGIVWELSR
ncbi:hypothetical protein N7491_000681 [Penicillium cf. griseofulvum]|uniref:Uncharacterized protein n=1 Tax=Penicillium cf. griseofulvum TaxID=2972120 RepID=A0A9W9INM9_9EURO|nr:hypothetical protein N7472_011087 [Penicillium cf. griseofulvum]KAJ5442843.1 hypothetical protein N7445_004594 [Penicillium cf. griseofulvum]KAJ5451499.1 hypothetical protein N7491_000681 [Penicillium cf. griseofulvum]